MLTLRKHIPAAVGTVLLTGLMAATAPAVGAEPEPYLGSIDFVGFNFAPRGWAFCDGRILSIAQNTALFSLFGTTYGGDGTTTFALPDLRGRAPMHMGTGPGLSPRTLGQTVGAETVTLLASQLPPHNHSAATTVDLSDLKVRANSGQATTPSPGGNALAATGRNNTYVAGTPNVDMVPGSVAGTASAATTVGLAGGGQPFSVMSPFLVLNCIVAMEGIYPPRD